ALRAKGSLLAMDNICSKNGFKATEIILPTGYYPYHAGRASARAPADRRCRVGKDRMAGRDVFR
ncbi:MAG: hypothetical protein ACP5I4_16125, partial [Oceanipulchritudo sp.]